MPSHLLKYLPRWLLCVPLLLGTLSSARAEELQKCPLKKFLALGFYDNKSLSPQLRDTASEEILKKGHGAALRPLLSDSDQELACFQVSCLEALAKRFYDADYIVGGVSVPVAGTTNYQVQVWIFDTKARDKPAQDRQIWAKDDCIGCADKDVARTKKLAQLLSKTVEEQVLKNCPAKITTPTKTGSCWTFARGLTLGAGASLTAAGLISGSSVLTLAGPSVDLSSSNGMTYSGKDATVWRPYAAPAFTAMGVGLAGIIVALVGGHMFDRGAPRDANGACLAPANPRWSTGRGAAAGVFAGFLAAGLSAAIPLTVANHNVTCFKEKNMTTGMLEDFTCDWSRNMGLAWGMSSGALVGLTLSLAWPSVGGGP